MNRKFVGVMIIGGLAVAAGLAATTDDANAGHRHRGWGSCGYAACGHGGFEYDDDDACGWVSCGHDGWCGGYSGCGYSSCGFSSCGYSSCGGGAYCGGGGYCSHGGHCGPSHIIRRTTIHRRYYYRGGSACSTSCGAGYGGYGYANCGHTAYHGYYGGY